MPNGLMLSQSSAFRLPPPFWNASSPCLKWCPTAGASLFRIISPVISGNRLLTFMSHYCESSVFKIKAMQLLNLLFLSMSLNSYNFQNHKITLPRSATLSGVDLCGSLVQVVGPCTCECGEIVKPTTWLRTTAQLYRSVCQSPRAMCRPPSEPPCTNNPSRKQPTQQLSTTFLDLSTACEQQIFSLGDLQ